MRVLGYARVSTSWQEDAGNGLAAQKAAITRAAHAKDWQLLDIECEQGSGRDLERPGLLQALKRLANGDADGLVVSKLDRLTRSLADFSRLMEWFDQANVTIVVLDFNLDTSTPTGEMMASIMAALAQWERRIGAQRTSDALQAIRAQGRRLNQGGVIDNPQIADRILALRAQGASLREICRRLDEENVPTVRGGAQWRPSSVVSILGYARPARRKSTKLPEIA